MFQKRYALQNEKWVWSWIRECVFQLKKQGQDCRDRLYVCVLEEEEAEAVWLIGCKLL